MAGSDPYEDWLGLLRPLGVRCCNRQRRHRPSPEQEPGDDGPDHQEDGGTFEYDVVAVNGGLRLQRGH